MGAFTQLHLDSFPPIYIFGTHLNTDDLHDAEEALYHAGGRLTYEADEARLFLTKVSKSKRAAFDLRSAGVWTEEATVPALSFQSPSKRPKLAEGAKFASSKNVEASIDTQTARLGVKRKASSDGFPDSWPDLFQHVMILRLDWLTDCLEQNKLLPYQKYLVYFGSIRKEPTTPALVTGPETSTSPAAADATTQSSAILARALADAPQESRHRGSDNTFGQRRRFNQSSGSQISNLTSQAPQLHRTTTSEYERLQDFELPPLPEWMLEPHPRPLYSCLRPTPAKSPNAAFIEQLNKVKEGRLLTLDEIGVRAYSTSIASIAAYPHRIQSPVEVTRLPGCDQKIAALWSEWHESANVSSRGGASSSDQDSVLDSQRALSVVRELEDNEDMKVLRVLYQIWGVGADTARKFYFQNGWKDLDDVVEFGWKSLNRVQQIGVKFYDEFQVKIPKAEVEGIAFTVLRHARSCKSVPREHWSSEASVRSSWADKATGEKDKLDPRDFVSVIVGGYRRGKTESGDVDVVLSHRDDRMTHDVIIDIVASLESEGYITHTLVLNTTTSDRGGSTLPFRADDVHRHHFDSLDKAMCVWQDPKFDDKGGTRKKNPNVHRRVDIIISPWRSVGAAILGWSGGTTFQRDIRRWVKRERGWKFDSSGVRDRRDGALVVLEEPREKDGGDSWQDRERRLMEGLGIGFTAATMRCTG